VPKGGLPFFFFPFFFFAFFPFFVFFNENHFVFHLTNKLCEVTLLCRGLNILIRQLTYITALFHGAEGFFDAGSSPKLFPASQNE
jgi:hypothetical protein